MRKTKIIATVGPSCETAERLQALIEVGVDVLRINASHTTPEEIRQWVRKIRKVASQLKKSIPVMVDLQGPRIRTGSLKGGVSVILEKGKTVSIIATDAPGNKDCITTSCRLFSTLVKKGDPVLIDNGYLELHVLRVHRTTVECKVHVGGVLGQNKGINLPNAPTKLPVLTQKDVASLKMAVLMKVNYIALSFVRNAEDIQTVKKILRKLKREIPIIAKIEKPQAVKHIKEILQVSEGIMVARGDLGIEMGVEKVPMVQKRLIRYANRVHLPVITATQMLESMMEWPRPTRAEASDIANAVLDGSDAVMLSGETAIGKYPKKAVRVMVKIIQEVERYVADTRHDYGASR